MKDNKLKVDDIVGNTIWGFNFKVLVINNWDVKIQNMKTNEIIDTNLDNVYKSN